MKIKQKYSTRIVYCNCLLLIEGENMFKIFYVHIHGVLSFKDYKMTMALSAQ